MFYKCTKLVCSFDSKAALDKIPIQFDFYTRYLKTKHFNFFIDKKCFQKV